jgi:hypothetical protein
MRGQGAGGDLAVPKLHVFRWRNRRNFVEIVKAVDQERTLCTERSERFSHASHQPRIIDADELPLGAGRVRERSKLVKDGPDSKISPRLANHAHRGMVCRRKQEDQIEVRQFSQKLVTFASQLDPEGF